VTLWALLKDGIITFMGILLATNLLYFSWRALIGLITAPLTALFTLNFNGLLFHSSPLIPMFLFTVLSLLSLTACLLLPKLYRLSKYVIHCLINRLNTHYEKLIK